MQGRVWLSKPPPIETLSEEAFGKAYIRLHPYTLIAESCGERI